MRLIDADQFGVISLQGKSEDFIDGVKFMLEKIDKSPTIERPHGEWIDKGEYAECSLCGSCSGTQFDGVEPIPLKTNFCPNCGADMRRKEGDSN